MTCIVGASDGSVVVIGADSAGVSGWDLEIRADRKVFRNGSYVMGFTSSYRMGQLLQYAFQPPEPPLDDLYRFMVTTFVNATRECLKAGGFARKELETETAGAFLVGVRGRLFGIDSDYQVRENADHYDAVGAGAIAARGAIHALSIMSVGDAEQRVRVALQTAERMNAAVRAPFHLEFT